MRRTVLLMVVMVLALVGAAPAATAAAPAITSFDTADGGADVVYVGVVRVVPDIHVGSGRERARDEDERNES